MQSKVMSIAKPNWKKPGRLEVKGKREELRTRRIGLGTREVKRKKSKERKKIYKFNSAESTGGLVVVMHSC